MNVVLWFLYLHMYDGVGRVFSQCVFLGHCMHGAA